MKANTFHDASGAADLPATQWDIVSDMDLQRWQELIAIGRLATVSSVGEILKSDPSLTRAAIHAANRHPV